MKERGIPFSDEMVRAILDGRKTQTRRAVKLRANDGVQSDHAPWRYTERAPDGRHLWQHRTDIRRMIVERCPYGVVGDRLWVREAWAPFYAPGSGLAYPEPDTHEANAIRYRATPDHVHAYPTSSSTWTTRPTSKREHVWRPSIFLPRWASRITLEITNVRVQRVDSISGADAWAEGVCGLRDDERGAFSDLALRHRFMRLWKSINGDGSWDANPWVWALTFKRVDAA